RRVRQPDARALQRLHHRPDRCPRRPAGPGARAADRGAESQGARPPRQGIAGAGALLRPFAGDFLPRGLPPARRPALRGALARVRHRPAHDRQRLPDLGSDQHRNRGGERKAPRGASQGAGGMTEPPSRPFLLAIDGPAGAGKSTVSREVARRLGFTMIDTGALYRAVALAAHRAGIAYEDEPGLARLLEAIDLRLEEDKVYLDGEDVSLAIRTPEMSLGASRVSTVPAVRQGLLRLQRDLGLA